MANFYRVLLVLLIQWVDLMASCLAFDSSLDSSSALEMDVHLQMGQKKAGRLVLMRWMDLSLVLTLDLLRMMVSS